MKVKLLCDLDSGSNKVGEKNITPKGTIIDVDEKEAKLLIEGDAAELVEKKEKPEGLPRAERKGIEKEIKELNKALDKADDKDKPAIENQIKALSEKLA